MICAAVSHQRNQNEVRHILNLRNLIFYLLNKLNLSQHSNAKSKYDWRGKSSALTSHTKFFEFDKNFAVNVKIFC